MRIGRIFGIPVRVNPMALLLGGLAVWLGEGNRLMVMSGSILLHELMHIAAARLMHVRVIELELMPTGGAARLDKLWQLRPGQISMVALAGPTCNLLIMLAAAAMCWWEIAAPYWAAMVIEQNAVIFLFNLLPALPLDGGRVLCGLLGRKMSPAGAARVGVRIGQMTGIGLFAAAAYGLTQGKLNITLPVAAVFLLISARREQRQADSAAIESLAARAAELEEEGILPVRWLAVRESTPVYEAAARLRPRMMHMIAVYDERMEMKGVVCEQALLHALLEDGMFEIGRMVRNVKKNVF